jgi:hypothetical protein
MYVHCERGLKHKIIDKRQQSAQLVNIFLKNIVTKILHDCAVLTDKYVVLRGCNGDGESQKSGMGTGIQRG